MSDFITGDTAPDFTATLTQVDSNGVTTVVNLTGATVVAHLMTPTGLLTVTATIDAPATSGAIRYPWALGDLTDARAGVWRWEAQVTFSNGKVQTFPGAPFTVLAQLA